MNLEKMAIEQARRIAQINARMAALNRPEDGNIRSLSRMLACRHFPAGVERMKAESDLLVERSRELRAVMEAMKAAGTAMRFAKVEELLPRAEALVEVCEQLQASITSDVQREAAVLNERN